MDAVTPICEFQITGLITVEPLYNNEYSHILTREHFEGRKKALQQLAEHLADQHALVRDTFGAAMFATRTEEEKLARLEKAKGLLVDSLKFAEKVMAQFNAADNGMGLKWVQRIAEDENDLFKSAFFQLHAPSNLARTAGSPTLLKFTTIAELTYDLQILDRGCIGNYRNDMSSVLTREHFNHRKQTLSALSGKMQTTFKNEPGFSGTRAVIQAYIDQFNKVDNIMGVFWKLQHVFPLKFVVHLMTKSQEIGPMPPRITATAVPGADAGVHGAMGQTLSNLEILGEATTATGQRVALVAVPLDGATGSLPTDLLRAGSSSSAPPLDTSAPPDYDQAINMSRSRSQAANAELRNVPAKPFSYTRR